MHETPQFNRRLNLENERQVEYYENLRRKKVPKFFDHVLTMPHHWGDFVQAAACLAINREDRWCYEHIILRLRSQADRLTPRQLRAFTESYLHQANSISPTALLTPFVSTSSYEKCRDRAIAIIGKIAEVLSHEDILNAPCFEPGTFLLLSVLLATQNGSHTWEHFIRALQEGNPACEKIFGQLWELWMVFSSAPKFVSAKDMPAEMNLAQITRIAEAMEQPRGSEEECQILVPENSVVFCNSWLRRRTAELTVAVPWWQEMLKSFKENENAFQEHADALWHEITTSPRYGLRPNGHDIVRIDIPQMRSHGYREIQLFPAPLYPGFKARLWIELSLTGTRRHRDIEVYSSRLEAVIANADDTETTAGRFLRYLCIKAYWSIVAGHYRREGSYSSKASSKESEQSDAQRAFLFRPHFRRLPKTDWRASKYAEQRSMSFWQQKPLPGFTFVMERSEEERAKEILALPPNFNHPVFALTESALPQGPVQSIAS